MMFTGYGLLVLTTVYFTFFVFRLLKLFLKITVPLWIIPIIYLIIFITSLPARNFLDIKAVVYFHIFVVSLILEVIYFFVKRYKIGQYLIPTGLLCVIIVSCVLGYGYYNMHHIKEKKYVIESDKIDDLKIAVIADLHMGLSMDEDDLKKLCDEINEKKADMVVLDGDIFDEYTTYQQMKDSCQILGALYHTKGIYYVYGNHDSNLYTTSPQYQTQDIKEEFEKNGVVVLDDEIKTVDDVTIIGRGDARFYNDGSRLVMEELYQKVTSGQYVIVLDHQPLDLELNESLGCDLQISGHTHGGQLFPQGIVQSLISDTLVYGKRQINDFTAITTSGVAGWKYPIKTGAPCEYLIIEVK